MGFKFLELFTVKDNKFINYINKYINKSITKNMKNGRTNPKISDENDDDEPHVIGLKDELLQHLADYDHYLDSRTILDPQPPPAPSSIFLLFFNIYF